MENLFSEKHYRNGDLYIGQVLAGRPRGTGILLFTTPKSIFEGLFHNGVLEGNGTQINEEKAFRGGFSGGLQQGLGLEIDKNTTRFGSFSAGKFSSGIELFYSRLSFTDSTKNSFFGGYFDLAFKSGLFGHHIQGSVEGFAHEIISATEDFFGYFSQGLRSGIGLTKSSTFSHLGDWRESHQCGFGIYYSSISKSYTLANFEGSYCASKVGYSESESSKYVGEFCDGLYSGIGYLSSKNSEYTGFFQQGLKHGIGSQSTPQDKYLGEWAHGLRHGYGIVFKDGHKIEGEFVKGMPNGIMHVSTLEYGQYLAEFKNGRAQQILEFQDNKTLHVNNNTYEEGKEQLYNREIMNIESKLELIKINTNENINTLLSAAIRMQPEISDVLDSETELHSNLLEIKNGLQMISLQNSRITSAIKEMFREQQKDYIDILASKNCLDIYKSANLKIDKMIQIILGIKLPDGTNPLNPPKNRSIDQQTPKERIISMISPLPPSTSKAKKKRVNKASQVEGIEKQILEIDSKLKAYQKVRQYVDDSLSEIIAKEKNLSNLVLKPEPYKINRIIESGKLRVDLNEIDAKDLQIKLDRLMEEDYSIPYIPRIVASRSYFFELTPTRVCFHRVFASRITSIKLERKNKYLVSAGNTLTSLKLDLRSGILKPIRFQVFDSPILWVEVNSEGILTVSTSKELAVYMLNIDLSVRGGKFLLDAHSEGDKENNHLQIAISELFRLNAFSSVDNFFALGSNGMVSMVCLNTRKPQFTGSLLTSGSRLKLVGAATSERYSSIYALMINNDTRDNVLIWENFENLQRNQIDLNQAIPGLKQLVGICYCLEEDKVIIGGCRTSLTSKELMIPIIFSCRADYSRFHLLDELELDFSQLEDQVTVLSIDRIPNGNIFVAFLRSKMVLFENQLGIFMRSRVFELQDEYVEGGGFCGDRTIAYYSGKNKELVFQLFGSDTLHNQEIPSREEIELICKLYLETNEPHRACSPDQRYKAEIDSKQIAIYNNQQGNNENQLCLYGLSTPGYSIEWPFESNIVYFETKTNNCLVLKYDAPRNTIQQLRKFEGVEGADLSQIHFEARMRGPNSRKLIAWAKGNHQATILDIEHVEELENLQLFGTSSMLLDSVPLSVICFKGIKDKYCGQYYIKDDGVTLSVKIGESQIKYIRLKDRFPEAEIIESIECSEDGTQIIFLVRVDGDSRKSIIYLCSWEESLQILDYEEYSSSSYLEHSSLSFHPSSSLLLHLGSFPTPLSLNLVSSSHLTTIYPST